MKHEEKIPDVVALRSADIEEIVSLREEVLIRGTTYPNKYFDGDTDPNTRHYGAFINGRCVCCATLMHKDIDGVPGWQLRGMATDPTLQGKGIGSQLLKLIEDSARAENPKGVLWCNAQLPAARFYEKHGWRPESEEFVIDGVGPHRRMAKRLGNLPHA
ncbi:MAG: GNAT family N-acetyltransferase [Candidatus Brocadiia bacterium]